MTVTKFEVGKEYSFSDIALYALETYMVEDNDINTIGLGFISLEHEEKDIIHSFVLTSASASECYYTCAYSDKIT